MWRSFPRYSLARQLCAFRSQAPEGMSGLREVDVGLGRRGWRVRQKWWTSKRSFNVRGSPGAALLESGRCPRRGATSGEQPDGLRKTDDKRKMSQRSARRMCLTAEE